MRTAHSRDPDDSAATTPSGGQEGGASSHDGGKASHDGGKASAVGSSGAASPRSSGAAAAEASGSAAGPADSDSGSPSLANALAVSGRDGSIKFGVPSVDSPETLAF